MTNKLPEIGKKYSWKFAPYRYHLVIGFFKNKIVAIQDQCLDDYNHNDEKALECFELIEISGFNYLTNLVEYKITNKLPVVCNKYTNRITGTVYKAFKHKARENCYFMESQSESPDLVVNLDSFWREFEEFPE